MVGGGSVFARSSCRSNRGPALHTQIFLRSGNSGFCCISISNQPFIVAYDSDFATMFGDTPHKAATSLLVTRRSGFSARCTATSVVMVMNYYLRRWSTSSFLTPDLVCPPAHPALDGGVEGMVAVGAALRLLHRLAACAIAPWPAASALGAVGVRLCQSGFQPANNGPFFWVHIHLPDGLHVLQRLLGGGSQVGHTAPPQVTLVGQSERGQA